MICKLFAFVGSDSVNKVLTWLQKLNHRIRNGLCCSAINLFEQCHSRFAFGEGCKPSTMPLSHDGVHFPVAQTLACIDNVRSIINAHSVREYATTIIAAITLLTPLLTTQVAVEVTTHSFVRQDRSHPRALAALRS
jgi:hypothetical protein